MGEPQATEGSTNKDKSLESKSNMDPYLLARIGDVTIQRILPKPDTPRNENNADEQLSSTENVELDLSIKNRSSIPHQGEDEGGGHSKAVADSKPSDHSEASDGDVSEDMDEEDEQDVPLSLVTNKRNQLEHVSVNPSNVEKEKETVKEQSLETVNKLEDSTKYFDQNKILDCDDKLLNILSSNMGPSRDSSESGDIDDDLPLSKLMAEAGNSAKILPSNFVGEESDVDDDDDIFQNVQKHANYDGDEDMDADGEGEDDLDLPETEDEPESLAKEEGQQQEDEEREYQEQGDEQENSEEPEPEDGEQGQEEQGSGDEDPDREMIVVKQEPFDEECDEDSNAKRKNDENDDSEDKTPKKSKRGSGGESGSDSESQGEKTNAEKKLVNLRKNIREVMDENQLDEATLSAQRQEMERLRRVQEQQRIIREVNRQINLNRQNTKTQTRVISLLQSGGTSLLKASPPGSSTSPKSTSPNTVLVKLSSGSGPPQVVNKQVLEILRSTKSATNASTSSKATALANKLLNKPHSLTPSVSIAPVKPGLTITKMSRDEDKSVASVRKVAGKPKQKGKDVVTISSGSSDEDDCILISEPSGGEEEEEEDDPTNSGMHTNDLYNVPDDQGRVLINVGRPENEPDVFLAPQIARIIKPHQIGGVRFLFDNVVESLERFKTSTGFGCILAHSMGLGKTLQVVSFCDVFLRYTEGKTVLCIMPINTLQNWLSEFNMWLPVEPSASPLAVHGEVQPRTFPLFVLNDLQKTTVARAKVVIQWAKEGGVLLIGYELYRQLSLQKPRKRRANTKRKINPDDDIDDEKNKHLLEEMHSALVKPGPDLVICDEGHRIKNSHASISQALKQIRSKRRVVLTGYPLQNNLLEYWCMVDFVRPNYLGSKTEFSNMFERPIQNGQCIDSTPQDIRLMRYRAHVLHSLLEGFVQRRSHSVLTHALPQKEEYVILVRMTTFQRNLYDTFMNEVVRTKAVPNPLKAFAVCCKIWNHPDVLYHFLKRRTMGSEAVDLDLEETAGVLAAAPGTVVPVMPVKRGRGRSPKGTSPVKRERKVNPRKRGEPETPAKSPVVAAIMPNTTSSNLQTADVSPQNNSSQSQQLDVKPPQNMQQFSQQPANNQFRPNFSYQQNNNQFPSQFSGMNSNYPNFNQQQQQTSDFHGMPPPPYPGFQNQQGFNNQNMYSGFGGNYYSSQQDPSFSGGSYWNNQFFNNDPNSSGMFPNFNDTDANSSNFYNQDFMGNDGFNAGQRGYNNMNMNRPGMSGMNPMQQGRMGMNNANPGMMGVNTNMGGMNMNSMGMPMNNVNPNAMNMQQNNFGMNSMNCLGMNTMGQNLGSNPQGQPGLSMSHNHIGLPSQSQAIGVNQMNNMNPVGLQSANNMNQGMSQISQGNPNSMSQQMGVSSQNTPTSSSMLTMNSNQSVMESQQQAAIENIANNLMMSSQKSMQANQPLMSNNDNQSSSSNQNNSPNMQSMQSTISNSKNLGNNPSHESQGMLGMLNNPGMPNTSQGIIGELQNQPNQLSAMQDNSQNQGPQNLPHTQNQTNMLPSSQSTHMMTNMMPGSNMSGQGSQSMTSLQSLGSSSSCNQNIMPTSQQSQNMLGNQLNTTPSNIPPNIGNMPNQQGFGRNQPNMPNMMGNMQNPMFRSQQSNQNLFPQPNALPMMNQGMYGTNNQQMQPIMGTTQNTLMNNQHITNQQPNITGAGGMAGLDQLNPQNILNQKSPAGSQQTPSNSQSQGMIGSQDSSGNSFSNNMSSQQNVGNIAASQDPHNNPLNQNIYGNQTMNNPMGNLQSMINNQPMMGSQMPSQNVMQGKSQNDLTSTQDTSHHSMMGMNQNMNMQSQQNAPSSSTGLVPNHPSGLNDSMMGQNNMLANQQHNTMNSSSNPLMDSQQNIFNMGNNQLPQSGFMNNQNMMNVGMGGSSNVMNNQALMPGSQNMGMMMNNLPMQNMYGNQMQMNSLDMMGGNSNMMTNQMNNANFNSNQMGCGNNMGMYNQPGIMNYQGMMMNNQMNNFGMMNQQNINNPNMLGHNQQFGNNMMRNPSTIMGMRNPQSVGMNPEMNQGMMNNFSNNQSNFGMFGNNMSQSNFNNSQINKGEPTPFQNNCGNSNNKFMSGGEYQTGNCPSGSESHGNLPQAFNNDFNNFTQNNDDNKMWDSLSNKEVQNPSETVKTEKNSSCEKNFLKNETEISKEEKAVKNEGQSQNQMGKPKIEDNTVSADQNDGKDVKKEESKSTTEEGANEEAQENTDSTATSSTAVVKSSRGEDAGIPYDWATELLKGYIPGNVEASAKMAILFCILEESMCLGDRVLVFSQSLFTLNLIEDFLQRTELPGKQERWARNWNYYRLDGSTSALEREKLINEFNSNPNIHLFLVSTRAGSLGINLVGANRVVVLDASWNPCHDTQAVCRVYRYGQRKPCFVYRLVTDNCLEKKIYDRQINKQGMADRVVDECNPDAHLSIKEVTNLCWDNEEDSAAKDYSDMKEKYIDVVMQKLLDKYSKFLSKEPFQHESLLVDRKDKKLSQAEKRLAKRSYELEKQANINNTRPVYGYYPGNTSGVGRGNPLMKPMASVRPIQSELNNQLIRDATSGRPRQWIPAEVWQKQGMSAQEMTLPLDVVIPTNSPDRSSIVLKAGQKVMVLKSPKGIYMQLENGKIIAIRTAFKVGGKGDKKGAVKEGESGIKKMVVQPTRQRAPASLLPLRNNSNISIIPRGSAAGPRGGVSGPRGPNKPLMRMLGANRVGANKQPVGTTKPYFGESSAHPPVTVTVTKKKVVGSQQASTSTAQVEVRKEPKQVTVTPIPPASPKLMAAEKAITKSQEEMSNEGSNVEMSDPKPSSVETTTKDEF